MSHLDEPDEQLIRRFETAWKGSEPRIEEFAPDSDVVNGLATLREMVIIDIEFRWKRFAAADQLELLRPETLDFYLLRFPQLRKAVHLEELAQEEFATRWR